MLESWSDDAQGLLVKTVDTLEIVENVETVALQLRGKVNISQLQGKIEFNTFLCDKPYNWCI